MKKYICVLLALVFVSSFCFAQTTDDEKYEHANSFYEAKEYKKVIPILNELAQKNHAKAINFLGVCYEHGNGVKKDLNKAVDYYKQSAALGWCVAQRNLGLCYEFGRGVALDLDKAEEWYKKAIENGDIHAMVRLGWVYYSDEYQDTHQSDSQSWDYYYKQAEKWFRLAAKKDSSHGYYGLAWLYYTSNDGDLLINDRLEKSTPIFEKAAKMGHGNAQLFMGYSEMRNYHYNTAINWFEQAETNNANYIGEITPARGKALCNFFKENPQYKYYWNYDCCALSAYIYPENNYIYVAATKGDKLGFLKISDNGKLLAHTPFIYDKDFPYYDEETKLFHVSVEGHDIIIDITGKEITTKE